MKNCKFFGTMILLSIMFLFLSGCFDNGDVNDKTPDIDEKSYFTGTWQRIDSDSPTVVKWIFINETIMELNTTVNDESISNYYPYIVTDTNISLNPGVDPMGTFRYEFSNNYQRLTLYDIYSYEYTFEKID